ncbi:MAG: CAP domain-containing protein [Sandaracinaceae bacterium]|nr:CAP domain-containing protein [Sandaracinaceae bacterium]
MRRLSTASAVVLGCLLASGVAAAQDFDAAGEQQMLARINAMRAAQQLGPLARHDGLDAAARAHSQDMAAQNALTHVSPTTGTPADRVRRAGVSATTIAENVALHRSAEDAHQALLGSDAHRANMMSPDITHVGLAALRTDRGVYVTQVFAAIGAPAPPAVAAAPAVAAPAAPAAPAVAAPAAAAPTAPAVAAPSAPAIAAPSQAPRPRRPRRASRTASARSRACASAAASPLRRWSARPRRPRPRPWRRSRPHRSRPHRSRPHRSRPHRPRPRRAPPAWWCSPAPTARSSTLTPPTVAWRATGSTAPAAGGTT